MAKTKRNGAKRKPAAWRKVDETSIEVNLDAPLHLEKYQKIWPKPSREKKGWVKVERRGDDLYVGGRKVVLDANTVMKSAGAGEVHGPDANDLHQNIRNALVHNPHLIPENWELDSDGVGNCVLFWGSVIDEDGNLIVGCLQWDTEDPLVTGWKKYDTYLATTEWQSGPLEGEFVFKIARLEG